MKPFALLAFTSWCTFVVASVPNRDPKTVIAYRELFQAGKDRDYELTQVNNPPGTLGHVQEKTFAVPPGLRARVDFWMRIFSEFSTTQTVLHDEDIPNLIYKVVDLSPILGREYPSHQLKMNAVDQLIQREKEGLARQALALQSMKSSLQNSFPPFALFRKLSFEDTPEAIERITGRIRSQIGQRDRLVRGFLHSGRYLDPMMEIFERYRIPKELTRLPLVESAFNTEAKSRVGASGIWQFMKDTGRDFLKIDGAVDERNDPIAATRAAAIFLRRNYETLGSWPLAITAYNHGPAGVRKAVRELGSSDIAHIVENYEGRSFGFASSNFYAEFLAILEIEREYRRLFGPILIDAPMKFREASLASRRRFADVALACGLSPMELWDYNPGVTSSAVRGSVPLPKGLRIKFPSNRTLRCKRVLSD